MKRLIPLGLFLFAALITNPAFSQSLHDLGFEARGETKFNWWFNSDDDDSEEYTGHAIDYHSEGLQTWQVSGAITWDQDPVFGGSIERPFKDTPEQQELIKKTTESEMSLNRYLIYLQLPFLREFSNAPLIEFLSHVRVDYTRRQFYGRGEAEESAIYVPRDGELLILSPEDEFSYKTVFQDWNISLLRTGYFRFGVYRSQINKPYEANTEVSIEGSGLNALVMETKLTSYGIFMDVKSRSVHAIVKLGKVDFESMASTDKYDPAIFNESGIDFQTFLNFTPPFTLFSGPGLSENGFFITPHFGFEFRMDLIEKTDQNGNDIGELSMDIILMTGLNVEWYFH
jgi:hypothetical protein